MKHQVTEQDMGVTPMTEKHYGERGYRIREKKVNWKGFNGVVVRKNFFPGGAKIYTKYFSQVENLSTRPP